MTVISEEDRSAHRPVSWLYFTRALWCRLPVDAFAYGPWRMCAILRPASLPCFPSTFPSPSGEGDEGRIRGLRYAVYECVVLLPQEHLLSPECLAGQPRCARFQARAENLVRSRWRRQFPADASLFRCMGMNTLFHPGVKACLTNRFPFNTARRSCIALEPEQVRPGRLYRAALPHLS